MSALALSLRRGVSVGLVAGVIFGPWGGNGNALTAASHAIRWRFSSPAYVFRYWVELRFAGKRPRHAGLRATGLYLSRCGDDDVLILSSDHG